MRPFLSFLFGLLTMAAIVALGIIVNQNAQSAQLGFLDTSLRVAQGWAIAGAAVLGFILAFLLLIPGRLASAMRSSTLSRQEQHLEERLQQLREEHAQLQGSYQRLLAEHQTILSQVLAPTGAPVRQPAALAAATVTPQRADPPVAAFAARNALRPTGPIRPPRPANRLADQAATTQHPASLMDRVRERLATWKAQAQAWFARLRSHGDAGNAHPRNPTPAAT